LENFSDGAREHERKGTCVSRGGGWGRGRGKERTPSGRPSEHGAR